MPEDMKLIIINEIIDPSHCKLFVGQLVSIFYSLYMKSKLGIILTILFFPVIHMGLAQSIIVQGTVSDEYGLLPNANITIKGTTEGTVSDFDGKYSIRAQQGDTLVFSHFSKFPEERTVSSSVSINVFL